MRQAASASSCWDLMGSFLLQCCSSGTPRPLCCPWVSPRWHSGIIGGGALTLARCLGSMATGPDLCALGLALAFFNLFPTILRSSQGSEPLAISYLLLLNSPDILVLYVPQDLRGQVIQRFLASTPGVGFQPLSWGPFWSGLNSNCDEPSQEEAQRLPGMGTSSAETWSA